MALLTRAIISLVNVTRRGLFWLWNMVAGEHSWQTVPQGLAATIQWLKPGMKCYSKEGRSAELTNSSGPDGWGFKSRFLNQVLSLQSLLISICFSIHVKDAIFDHYVHVTESPCTCKNKPKSPNILLNRHYGGDKFIRAEKVYEWRKPARDEFFGDEVHPVTEWRHQSDVGVAVESGKLGLN